MQLPSSFRTFACALLPAVLPLSSLAQAITLQEAVDIALENNLGLQIERLQPLNAADTVVSEAAAFDVEVFASAIHEDESGADVVVVDTGDPNAQPTEVVIVRESTSQLASAGARKRLSLGTTVTAETRLDRFSSRTERNDADLSLNVRQPLLRNFGPKANLAPIRAAEAGLAAARENLRGQIEQVLQMTEGRYWQLAFMRGRLELLQSSLQVAEALLEETQERLELGVATRVDVLQAQASLAERRQAVLSAQQDVYDAADALLIELGVMAAERPFDADLEVRSLPEETRDWDALPELWVRTLASNPATAAQAAVVEQRRQQLIAARNEALPNVDLVAGGGFSGFDDASRGEAIDNTLNREGDFWSVGVEFSMPWGLRRERAQERIRERQVTEEELQLAQLKLDLMRDLRQSLRALTISNERQDAAALALELQEESFARERTRYQTGLATFRDVLEAQRDLDDARLNLLDARLESIQADLDLAHLTGALLERYNLTLDNSR